MYLWKKFLRSNLVPSASFCYKRKAKKRDGLIFLNCSGDEVV